MSPTRPSACFSRIAPACLLVLLSTTAHAQEGIEGRPITLPDVVISPTTLPTPAADVGSAVTVFNSQQIEAEQRRTVPDLLAQAPGLNVVQTGGPGGQTSVFIRGTNSNHVKVLIDGIDASDPSNPNGSFDFGQLLTADLDRVEVLRGPQSGLYGSDAIGGVISIFTKAGEGPPKLTFRAEGGSFGTANQVLGFSGGTPVYDYAFNIAHFQTRDVPVTPPELEPPGRRTIGNAYNNATFSTKLGLHFSDSLYTNATLRYIDSTLRFTGMDFSFFPAVPQANQSSQHDQQLYTRAELHYDPVGTTVRNRIGVSYTQSYTTTIDPENGNTTNFGTRLKADYQGQLELLKGETVVAGAETQTDRLAQQPTFAKIGNTAGYIQLLSNVGNRIFVASNVRYDSNDAFGDHVTFRVAPSFHVPVSETIIKASYGTGFKAPTLSELYVNFPSFGFFGNPNLKPESSEGYDIGVEQPFGRRVSAGATYYQNNITNLIDSNATFTSYTNIGRAKTYGTEVFVGVAVTPTLRLRADYTLTIANDEILHQELLRRPRNKGSLQVFWSPTTHLTLSGTVIAIGAFVDGNYDFSIPRLSNGGHTTANVAANYLLTDNAKLFARVDNLFNLRYQDPTGFLQPSLAAIGGVQLTY